MSDNKTPEKIVRQAAAKAKAKKKAAEHVLAVGTAIAAGLYVVPKICIDCGATRMCKKADAWQVKRCVECQKKKTTAGLKAFIAKVSDPAVQVAKRADDRLKRLDAWVERTNREMHDAFERRDEFYAKLAKEPKYVGFQWP